MGNTVYYRADGTDVTEYELEQQFDEMLDDVYGMIKLFDRYEYSYGEAVKTLDPILYREAFWEYIGQQCEDEQLFEDNPLDSED